MEKNYLNIIYQDHTLLVIDKPAGIVVFSENRNTEDTLIDCLLSKFPELKNVGNPPRYGIAHRLDKETSGILLVAKNNGTLEFLQNKFKAKEVIKQYLTLVTGKVKEKKGIIDTFMGRSPQDRRRQKVYLPFSPEAKKEKTRRAITCWKKIKEFTDYTLLEAIPKTGRKHQIRAHFYHIGHPIAGDKLYCFKDQPLPQGLNRQFLHSFGLKIKMADGQDKKFQSDLPPDLKKVLENLN